MAGPLGYNIAVFNYPTQEEANVTMDFSRYDGFSPSENENRMAMDQGDYAENYGPTVFHYTSIDSLHKILEGKELSLNNTRTMNDAKEVRSFIENLEKAVSDDLPPEHLSESAAFFASLYNQLEQAYPFASCFSSLEDDASLWERYADNARGVCLAFNTEALYRMFRKTSFKFNNIYYQYNIRNHFLYPIVKEYLETGKLTGYASREQLAETIIAVSALRKHASFQSEREFRLTSFYVPEATYTRIEFKVVNGVIRKYLNINLAQLAADNGVSLDDLYQRIIIGPASSQNRRILQEYLQYAGYPTLAANVYKSDCPLR